MSALTCFLCWLPFSSSAFLGGSSRASLTVRSSRDGIGRNCRPLFLVPETTAWLAAAATTAEVVSDGYWGQFGLEVAKNGGVGPIAISALLFAFVSNLGDKLASKSDANMSELKVTIEKLASKSDANIDALKTSMEKNTGELKVSMAEVAGKSNTSNEKIAGELRVSMAEVSGKMDASIEKLSGEMQALRSESIASTTVLSAKTDVEMAELKSELKVGMGELAAKTEALRSSTDASLVVLQSNIHELHQKNDSTTTKLDHATKTNDEPPMTDSGSDKNITRDPKVKPDT